MKIQESVNNIQYQPNLQNIQRNTPIRRECALNCNSTSPCTKVTATRLIVDLVLNQRGKQKYPRTRTFFPLLYRKMIAYKCCHFIGGKLHHQKSIYSLKNVSIISNWKKILLL